MDSKAENGGYAFLSHSHKDFRIVRQIRNEMEERGFEPLCFYLKCLDNCDKELLELIEHEIDARELFYYLDSPNARNSEYVQYELNYAKRTKGEENIGIIPLDEGYSAEELIAIAGRIMDSMRIYLSYSRADQKTAEKIYDAFVERGYKVFNEDDFKFGLSLREQILNSIDEAAQRGCLIALVTEHSADMANFKYELKFAVSKNALIIPAVVKGCEYLIDFSRFPYHCIIDEDITDEQLKMLVKTATKALIHRFNNHV